MARSWAIRVVRCLLATPVVVGPLRPALFVGHGPYSQRGGSRSHRWIETLPLHAAARNKQEPLSKPRRVTVDWVVQQLTDMGCPQEVVQNVKSRTSDFDANIIAEAKEAGDVATALEAQIPDELTRKKVGIAVFNRLQAARDPTVSSEQAWQHDQQATELAMELSSKKFEPAGNQKVGLEVLEAETKLFPYEQSGSVLLSRVSVREAWDAAFAYLQKGSRVAMLGRPGVGKSRSLLYGLSQLMRHESPPQAIILESRVASTVYRFTQDDGGKWKACRQGMNGWSPETSDELASSENWHLIDAYRATDPDVLVRAKAIKACSPDRNHHSDFVKESGTYVFVPDWTLDEIHAAYDYLDGAPVKSIIDERFKCIGGNLRGLLSDQDDYKQIVDNMNADAKKRDLVYPALQGDLSSTGLNLPTRLLTYIVQKAKKVRVGFCSEQAQKMVFGQHYDQILETLTSRRDNAQLGYALEDFVGEFLFTGGLEMISGSAVKLDVCELALTTTKKGTKSKPSNWLRTPKGEAFEAPRSTLRTFSDEESFLDAWTAAITTRKLGNCEHWAAPVGFVAIDFLVDYNHAVQVTASQQHTLKKGFLEKLRRVGADKLSKEGFTFTFLVLGAASTFTPKGQTGDDIQKVVQDLQSMGVTVQVAQIPPQSSDNALR